MPRVDFEKRRKDERKGGQRGWSSGWLTQQREGALTNQVRTIKEGRVVINMANSAGMSLKERRGTLKTL